MLISPRLFSRYLTGAPLALPAGLVFRAESYAHAAIGGPSSATISVSGPIEAVVQVLTWLRCPVELIDDRKRKVWWGFINDVSLTLGSVQIGAGLSAMGNSVTIAYALTNGASVGSKQVTAAALDADSIAEYGTKELQISMGDGSPVQAVQLRDIVLAARRYPVPHPELGGGDGGVTAKLECRGWWDTLDWKQYIGPAAQEGYAGVNNMPGDRRWGTLPPPNPTNLMTLFSIPVTSQGFNLTRVSASSGGSAATIDCKLWTNVAGVPGAVLGIGTVPASPPEGNPAWDFASIPIVPGVSYWLVFSVAGDPGPVFEAATGSVYARGGFGTYLSGWTVNYTQTMLFMASGTVETSAQLAALVATHGQFLTGSDIITPSGVWSNSYRNGDLSAKAEAEALLASGSIANARMLARVTTERRVQIYAEPISTSIANYVDGRGQLYDAAKNKTGAELCPCGVWVGLHQVLPISYSGSRLAPVTPFFVESASVDVASGKWRPTARGITSVFKIGIV